MKHLRFFIGAALLMMGATAAKSEIVITADQETTVKVAQVKNLSFDGDFNTGNLLVNYTDGTTDTMPISSIKQISFKADEQDNAIESVSAQPTIAVKGNMLFITATGGKAAIYDTAGKLMNSVALTEGTTPLSLSQMPDGVYLLNINGHVVKFQKK